MASTMENPASKANATPINQSLRYSIAMDRGGIRGAESSVVGDI